MLSVTLAALAATGVIPKDVAERVSNELGNRSIPPTFQAIYDAIAKAMGDSPHPLTMPSDPTPPAERPSSEKTVA